MLHVVLHTLQDDMQHGDVLLQHLAVCHMCVSVHPDDCGSMLAMSRSVMLAPISPRGSWATSNSNLRAAPGHAGRRWA
jgi:hypothetical protein